jgi:hypothetical protein
MAAATITIISVIVSVNIATVIVAEIFGGRTADSPSPIAGLGEG